MACWPNNLIVKFSGFNRALLLAHLQYDTHTHINVKRAFASTQSSSPSSGTTSTLQVHTFQKNNKDSGPQATVVVISSLQSCGCIKCLYMISRGYCRYDAAVGTRLQAKGGQCLCVARSSQREPHVVPANNLKVQEAPQNLQQTLHEELRYRNIKAILPVLL